MLFQRDYTPRPKPERKGTPEKKSYTLKKVSDKRAKEIAEGKKAKGDQPGGSLTEFFNEQRKSMTGICTECSGPSSKFNDQCFHFSICHILPKRKDKFPSVATNENNWIELCAFGVNACHSKMDSSLDKMQSMKIWPLLVEKFKLVWPFVAAKERAKVPDCFLQELEPKK